MLPDLSGHHILVAGDDIVGSLGEVADDLRVHSAADEVMESSLLEFSSRE